MFNAFAELTNQIFHRYKLSIVQTHCALARCSLIIMKEILCDLKINRKNSTSTTSDTEMYIFLF